MADFDLAPAEPIFERVRVLLGESWRYLLVSVAALALDYGLLLGLTELSQLHYLLSAAVGFTTGLALNYILSISFVFAHRRLNDRWLEFSGFVGIGLLGLGLNEVMMHGLVEMAGLGYAIAKIPAASIGFLFNFGLRRALLFSRKAVIG